MSREIAMDTLDSSMMKKKAEESKTKGKNTGSTHDLHDIAIMVAGVHFFSPKLFDSSTCSIGCDTSS